MLIAVITLLPMISAVVVKGTMRGEPVHTLYYYMEGGSLVDGEMQSGMITTDSGKLHAASAGGADRTTLPFCVNQILLLSGDIYLNPGPSNWKHACGVCNKPVKLNQAGLQCDSCDTWNHLTCFHFHRRV